MESRALSFRFAAHSGPVLARAIGQLAFVGVLVAIAAPADAALKKYAIQERVLLHNAGSSPEVSIGAGGIPGVSLIDESGPNPVLRKAVFRQKTVGTVVVPDLSGFIFINIRSSEGPAADQTGMGSTASSILWGNMPGWTITGGTWCNAVPSLICGLAQVVNLGTVATDMISTNYDMGTWTFHGSGFTHSGYINLTTEETNGNIQWFLRGESRPDGTVPAIPLLGIGVVGLSVVAMGLAALRRR